MLPPSSCEAVKPELNFKLWPLVIRKHSNPLAGSPFWGQTETSTRTSARSAWPPSRDIVSLAGTSEKCQQRKWRTTCACVGRLPKALQQDLPDTKSNGRRTENSQGLWPAPFCVNSNSLKQANLFKLRTRRRRHGPMFVVVTLIRSRRGRCRAVMRAVT